MQINFPEKFSNKEGLDITIGEKIYIILETPNPTKIVFSREIIDEQEIAYISKIRQMKITKTNYFYPVFTLPKKLFNGKKLQKSFIKSEVNGGTLVAKLKE